MAVEIEIAGLSDAQAILGLQRVAYQSEARLYEGTELPPLTESLDEILAEFGQLTFLKAVLGSRIIGSVRACMCGDTCSIRRLIVHPCFQNQGLGTQLLEEAERRFPDARRYELFTGHRSADNIRLYQRLGYRECRREEITAWLTLVYLEKVKAGAPGDTAGSRWEGSKRRAGGGLRG
jgi:ribosomal protein S18 acetylase RimI-like enzyme